MGGGQLHFLSRIQELHCLSRIQELHCLSRIQEVGESEIHSLMEKVEGMKADAEELERDIQDKEADVKALQTEKELQSGGEVKELSEKADGLSKR